MVKDIYPLCKDTVRIKKYPSFCWAEELMYDTGFQLTPFQAFFFMLLKGDISISSLIYMMKQLFHWNNTSAEDFVIDILKKYKFCFEFLEVPLEESAKLLYNAEDFLYFPSPEDEDARFVTPVSMTLVLTNQCNFRCIYCFNDSGTVLGDEPMSTNEWLKLIDQAADMGILKCTITGGEPMVHPGFFDILQQLHKRNIITYICSNGSLLSDENVAKLAAMHQPLIQISMDSPFSKTHDRLTLAKDSLNIVIEGIKRLKKAGIDVYVKSVVLPDTINEIPALMDLCADLGVTNLVLDRYDLCHDGRGNNRFFLSKAQEKDLEMLVSKKKKELESRININLILGPRGWTSEEDIVTCGAFIRSFTVIPNGDVPVCEKVSGVPSLTVGNILCQSLSHIWSSPRIEEVLFPPAENYKEPCSNCEYLPNCNTGCFAAKRYFEDSQYGADPKCWKAIYPNNYFII